MMIPVRYRDGLMEVRIKQGQVDGLPELVKLVHQIRWAVIILGVLVGVVIGSLLTIPVAHADIDSQEVDFCVSIAGDPTEQGVWNATAELVLQTTSPQVAGAIAGDALKTLCPQWIPLVEQTQRDLGSPSSEVA